MSVAQIGVALQYASKELRADQNLPPKPLGEPMNAQHIDTLRAKRSITAAQHRALAGLVAKGVKDPCESGVSPGLAKLWYKHLPQKSTRQGRAIADARDMILGQGRAYVHYTLANKLGDADLVCSGPLEAYLSGWLGVTQDPGLVEAVTWRWLDAAGYLAGDAKDVYDTPVSAEAAKDTPLRVLGLLSSFRRHFDLWKLDPCATVDRLALDNGWWTESSPARGSRGF